MRYNQNAERRERHRACRQQMKEAGKSIYPTDTIREAQAHVPSELQKTREVRVWIPKHRAQKAHISEALPHRRDVQQHEIRISPQRHETRVSTIKRETQKVLISQVSLARCNNQQREVRVSSQQRRETRVSKPKCDSCVWPTECELHVSEPCVLELRRNDGSQKLKSPQKLRLISLIPL